ncbi:MAG: hypothetical protein M3O30_06890 [Planctomycetota bacterium]|nr:hypothetical protein [Planctomycetota bacterium]
MSRVPKGFSLFLLLWVAWPILGWAQNAPTSQEERPKTLAELKAEDEKLTDFRYARLNKLPPQSIGEILDLTCRNDHLEFDSPLIQSAPGDHLVPLNASPMIAMVSTFSGPPLGRVSFQFEAFDFSDPDLIDRHLQLLASPALLHLARDVEYIDKTETVALLQSAVGLSLHIQLITQKEGADAQPTHQSFAAPTLSRLRFENLAVYEQYLRPLFRELGNEQAGFAIDAKFAWQLFADTWAPPPELARQTDALVAKLNDNDFSTRSNAEKQLRALGQQAAMYLLRIDRKSLSFEQNARVDGIVRPYQPLTPDQVKASRDDLNVLLDCLFTDDTDLRTAALEHLQAVVGHAIPFDMNQPVASRLTAITRLRRELAPTTRQD